jgi:hypothetical protein
VRHARTGRGHVRTSLRTAWITCVPAARLDPSFLKEPVEPPPAPHLVSRGECHVREGFLPRAALDGGPALIN